MGYSGISRKIKLRPLRFIYILYWVLLAYIIAALVFWFFALNKQNNELSFYRKDILNPVESTYQKRVEKIEADRKLKVAQYLGEGVTFLLLIIAGAVFVFRMINKQLTQSQQQQNFMMAITHELKTPIAVTKLNLETMKKRQLEQDQQQKLIGNTLQEVNRLNALCNNMLLITQIDTGGYVITKEHFDLGMLARECENDFETRFPNRKMKASAEKGIILNGDKFLVELAVNNLLDNAIKYSGKDSSIQIKVFAEDKYVKLQVIDEGQGISEEEQSKVFDKYFRGAQKQAKGTGLGLYLSKKIVKQHNGDIWVDNNMPHGCIFTLQFKAEKT